MSLLLDALKKAAQDKQNAEKTSNELESSVHDNNGDSNSEVKPEYDAAAINTDLEFAELTLEDDVLDKINLDDSADDEEQKKLENEKVSNERLDVVNLPDDSVAVDEKLSINAETENDEPKEQIKQDNEITESTENSDDQDVSEKNVTAADVIGLPNNSDAAPTPKNIYSHDDAKNIIQVNKKVYKTKRNIIFYGAVSLVLISLIIGGYFYLVSMQLNAGLYAVQPKILRRPERVDQTNTIRDQMEPVVAQEEVVTKKQSVNEAVAKAIQKSNISKEDIKPATKKITPKPKISIVKQLNIDPLEEILNKAYSAYIKAAYDEAEVLYSQALLQDSKQRDALLGKAAIATVSSRHEEAASLYKQILKYHPKDTLALAALVDLQKKSPGLSDESNLKILIRDKPEDAHLYFSLGRVYAKQKQWASAQKEFFNAYSRDSMNGDYAFNLAVSLDHLGKQQAALSYYNKALALAEQQPVQFNEKSVLDRVQKLSDSHE